MKFEDVINLKQGFARLTWLERAFFPSELKQKLQTPNCSNFEIISTACTTVSYSHQQNYKCLRDFFSSLSIIGCTWLDRLQLLTENNVNLIVNHVYIRSIIPLLECIYTEKSTSTQEDYYDCIRASLTLLLKPIGIRQWMDMEDLSDNTNEPKLARRRVLNYINSNFLKIQTNIDARVDDLVEDYFVNHSVDIDDDQGRCCGVFPG